MTRRRTWWHLSAERRIPTRYEVVSGKLMRHPTAGLEVRLPFGEWYARYQEGGALASADWDAFKDPRELTYASYVRHQAARAAHVDMLFEGMEGRASPASWSSVVCELLAPALHPLHGLQMVSGYLGQLAPSGRLAILCLFQSSDLMRRVECSARTVHHLETQDPDVATDRRRRWEEHESWQPLRRTLEKLLVTWEWGESFAATNLVLLPLFPALLDRVLTGRAREAGESGPVELFRSLGEDVQRQLEWTGDLVSFLAREREENLVALRRWIPPWLEACEKSLAALLPGEGTRSALEAILGGHRTWLQRLGLA